MYEVRWLTEAAYYSRSVCRTALPLSITLINNPSSSRNTPLNSALPVRPFEVKNSPSQRYNQISPASEVQD